ncbi:hypothetical protein TNIN_226141 [Trichonephila inaurata madagascariensis]|uniref:Uncharacterized protein n=1 Tax=Trichonephila inaurata madagascariensis TaxID=2747483 RepID=A0A8X6X3V8_9ARAC|nr:hypothetical protein TNIN_226111 [Trichonephila inaurata madagascariensis]GFY44969.1 hypothetical protein TNIN_226141 [Trichonephila inaurata madagascariensis]
MSLHVSDAKISDLWRLDTLGILDPGEKGTSRQEREGREEHFNRSVKMDSDGRYVVSLHGYKAILPSHVQKSS